MTENLKKELELEYGSLLQQLETTFDWFEKSKIQKKLNAINCLLDIPYIEESFYTTGIDPFIKEEDSQSKGAYFNGKHYIHLHNNKK